MRKPRRNARGYDLYGNIAVIDAEPRRAPGLARRLMRENKNVETVLRKGGAVRGRYRTRKFVYVAGRRNYLATYRENGCIFRFDIRKTFFSTRLAFERKRVSDSARNGENVVVMFAGVGPYAIEIARQNKRGRVVAIELNAAACRYARENAKLNKTANVVVEHGDVDAFVGKYSGFADRIAMPLPGDSFRFLPAALGMAAKGCTIHYYAFCKIGESGDEVAKLRLFFSKRRRKFRLLGTRIARPYSAKDAELAIDFRID
ncbi:MAG: methyltransferase [Candidatus Micrarchaeota archaeon]|nr:methyltransferase [Candidatus Micrarchaeota archaeon]